MAKSDVVAKSRAGASRRAIYRHCRYDFLPGMRPATSLPATVVATTFKMEHSRFATLTARQRESLRLLASPMRPKEVAAAMGLSPRTVEDHLAEATRRVGAGSPLEAARLFAEHERETPGNPRTEENRVEPPDASQAVMPSPAAVEPASQGRVVTLGPWRRSAIIFGLTIGLIFSIFLLVAGGESVARVLRSELSTPRR